MGKKAVSYETKQRIVGMHLAGLNYAEISRTIGSVSPSCVSRTVKKYQLTGSTADKKRSGAPRKTSITDDNLIYRIARKNPFYSVKSVTDEINQNLNNRISRQTVGRRLMDRKLFSYTAARKPFLKRQDYKKRLKFCQQLIRMSDEQIKKIIFSDESNFTIINRKNRILVRRHQNEKYHSRMLAPRLQKGGGSTGIWGCITYDGPGLKVCYDGRINKYTYIDTLENYLIPTRDLFFGDGEWIFQQDNAPAHTAHLVKQWFVDNNINVLQWPARSPDLNPIENAWILIDKYLSRQHLTSIGQLKELLNQFFDGLSVEYCRKLFDSIKTRCRLCIKNKGGHIPY